MRSRDLRALGLLTRAWLLSIVRDRAAIFWFLALPLIFVTLFGLAFGRSDAGAYAVGVAVDEATPAGQALLRGLRAVPPFRVTSGAADAELEQLRLGRRHAVVTLTPGGAGGGTVVVYLDPSRGAAAQIVRPIIAQVVNEVDRNLTGRAPAFTVEERSVRSAALRYIDFFVPGIIAFQVMQNTLFAAIPLVQLRSTRVLKRFGATPLSRWTVLASQGLARLALALVTTALLLAAGWLLFRVRLDADWPGMVGFVILGATTFMAMGLAVSGLAPTAESVPALVQVVSFPMMFLSGVFFPIESFPGVLQPLIRALPLTHLADALRQTMVGGAALQPLWLDALALAAWGLVAAVLAVRFFKWE